jgi:2-oxoisovalerate dehydrogenase E1 component
MRRRFRKPLNRGTASGSAPAAPISAAALAASGVPQGCAPEHSQSLGYEELTLIYRTMYLSRKLDDKEINLKRQQKIFFQASGAGHEAVQVAAGLVLKAGYDWFFPYYRDRALCLTLGVTPLSLLLEAAGAATAPYSGGRQMPYHWGDPRLNIISQSSATGTQWLQAVGCAEAGIYYRTGSQATSSPRGRFQRDEVVLVSGGEGATSEGEFYESLNTSCCNKLPILYLIEDNGYAISVPVETQTPGGNISKLLAGYPNLQTFVCDGTDPLESLSVLTRAVACCRKGNGPALVHAHVIRPYSHSMSDDESYYRPEHERDADANRDPIPKFRQFLIGRHVLSEDDVKRLEVEVDEEVSDAADQALAAPSPSPEGVLKFIYSPDVDPTSAVFSTDAVPNGQPQTMVDLINRCLFDEMERDRSIVVFGQDVADCSRELNLDLVKGKGGVFKCTEGLQRTYGSSRVFNTPIAEANIIGRAVGMALRGLKPIVEIQFFDYIWPATMQIRDELAVLRWRSNNNFKCPIVIRVPIGGYLGGGGIYHSQSGESVFAHLPGLRVIMPATARDANGLLRTAIRCDDPVLFLEPKHLYRQGHNRDPYPGPDYMVPFGKATVVRQGEHLTIITYGSTVIRSMRAAADLQRESISVEIIDLRSLNPYDWATVVDSAKKTNRVLVVYEDWLSWGYGAEIAARIGEELFEFLDAPVTRVAAADCFCAYHPLLEDTLLPQSDDIAAAARTLVRY